MRPHLILGINGAYHETSAALIADGAVLAAVEEERLTGRKHGKPVRVNNADELPWRAMEACLRTAGVRWSELSAVAFSLDPVLRRKHVRLGTEGPPDSFGHPEGERTFQRGLQNVPGLLRRCTAAPFFFVPHHEAHAWYALGTSPFEEAAILVLDGIGEGATLSLGSATRRGLQLDLQEYFPYSVGLAWEKVARYLGYSEYDACKVMALAGLVSSEGRSRLRGRLSFAGERLHVAEDIFRLEDPDDFAGLEELFQLKRGSPELHHLAKSAEIAAALQQATESLLLDIAQELRRRMSQPHLAYGGGVALNCRANGALACSGIFEQIHVGPACHDAGTALGAAWHVHVHQFGGVVPHIPEDLVLAPGTPVRGGGPGAVPDEGSWRHAPGADPVDAAVRLLLRGELVGWLWGRCELGPRALGHRSLLASSLPADAVARLNAQKGRYGFEPAACSVREEDAEQLFEIPKAARLLCRHMLATVRPRSAWAQRLAHLLHSDGTVRLQTVGRQENPLFHRLLGAFFTATGLPMLLNTSFNPRGRPMPAGQAEALALVEQLGLASIVVDGELWTRHAGSLGAENADVGASETPCPPLSCGSFNEPSEASWTLGMNG
ncbi:MAG: carbamoyltransferase C-terminal domain-containing protein [Thermodesulfobacteriota bacterium]